MEMKRWARDSKDVGLLMKEHRVVLVHGQEEEYYQIQKELPGYVVHYSLNLMYLENS